MAKRSDTFDNHVTVKITLADYPERSSTKPLGLKLALSKTMKHSRTKYADNSGLNEKNDCVVRALSVAGGLEYSVAHRMLTVAGRKPRHSTSLTASIRMLETFYPHAQRVFVGGKATMSQFAAARPDGRWMVYTRNHAVALVDGVVYDWMPHPRSRVRWAWRLDT